MTIQASGAEDIIIGQDGNMPLTEDFTYTTNSVYIPSSTTGNSPNITISPNTGTLGAPGYGPSILSPSTWTWGTGANTTVMSQPTYAVLKLPRKKMPEKVFVQGMMKTCGLLGTDVECAYTDRDVVIFSPGVIPHYDPGLIYLTSFGQYNKSPTVSIEYHNAIYHYVVDYVPVKGDKSTTLGVRQVGMVKKGR